MFTCIDLFVAVGATELSDKPLLKALSVEGMTTNGQHLDFVATFKVSQADRTALVLERILSVGSWSH